MATKSGKFWVTWANSNAKVSIKVDDLESSFKTKVKAFKKALEDAGAKITISTTKRSKKRAYLFHWSWRISLGKVKASAAAKESGVDIQWDHGNEKESKAGAKEMVTGFGLAVPPKSTLAPSLTSHHIAGKAIDMTIKWSGTIKIKKKDNTEVDVKFNTNVNSNTDLHKVGESYGVKKNKKDAPHWSVDGK